MPRIRRIGGAGLDDKELDAIADMNPIRFASTRPTPMADVVVFPAFDAIKNSSKFSQKTPLPIRPNSSSNSGDLLLHPQGSTIPNSVFCASGTAAKTQSNLIMLVFHRVSGRMNVAVGFNPRNTRQDNRVGSRPHESRLWPNP